MKNKNLSGKLAGLFLALLIVSLSGCENVVGSGKTPSSSNTGTQQGTGSSGGTASGGDKLYFIKTAYQSETSGTLCYTSVNSRVINTVSSKTMADYSLNNGKTKLVFAEVLSGYEGTYIATMNLNGTGYNQTNVRGSNPCFSMDGTLIYFDDGVSLYSMNIDGTGKQIINIPGISGAKKFPRLSPDGTKLAFYQSSPGYKWYYDDVVYIYTYDLIDNRVTKLNTDSIPVSYLSWNSDGTMIAFSTTTGVTPPVHELWTVKTDGSEQPVRIAKDGNPATGGCGFPGFTNDDFILCGSTKNKVLDWRSSWDGNHYKYELAKIKTDGTSLTVLISGTSIKDPVLVTEK